MADCVEEQLRTSDVFNKYFRASDFGDSKRDAQIKTDTPLRRSSDRARRLLTGYGTAKAACISLGLGIRVKVSYKSKRTISILPVKGNIKHAQAKVIDGRQVLTLRHLNSYARHPSYRIKERNKIPALQHQSSSFIVNHPHV